MDDGQHHGQGRSRPRRPPRTLSWANRIALPALLVTVILLGSAGIGSAATIGGTPAITTPGSSAASFPTPIQHVFVIVEENEARATVLARAPFLATLAKEYASPVNFYAACHPSAPNYLALTGGLTHQCGADAYHAYANTNLADFVMAKGLSW
ncbi:MAG: hypothetical protein ACREDE_02160, partial [Thermoplasmata archaeon]